MLRSVRRVAALVAAPALASVALVAAPSPASAATDPAPVNAAAGWLKAQLTGNLVHNDQYGFDDLGLSADVAFGLDRIGGQDSTVTAITAAIEPRAEGEWYTSEFGGVTTTYAGSLAKAAALAQVAGSNPTDFGGKNLIADLEDTVYGTGARTGRVQDVNNDFSDTNTIGQAYAAQALDTADSTLTGIVSDFLIQQQCAAGWFRLDLAQRTASDQTCSGDAASAPDTDATAVAVAALRQQSDVPAVAASIAKAKTWLQSVQKPDGSFGGGPTTEAANANSTGLAGAVLGDLGDTAAATRAAVWVRSHQATNVGACAPYAAADAGAIAYDDAALTGLATTPVAAATRDQFRRATSQAAPVLAWAPAGTGTRALFTAEYVRAGRTVSVGVTGAAPGERLCVTGAGTPTATQVDAKGEVQIPVTLPKTTAKTVVTVTGAAGSGDTATINALGAAKLTVKAKKKVVRGKRLAVVVRGLAPAEAVTVKIPGARASGLANGKGVFKAKLKVKRKPGKAKIAVRGQFVDRKGARTVKIVKPRRAGR